MTKLPGWGWLILGLALLLAIKFLYIDKSKNTQAAKSKGAAPVACNYVVVRPRSLSNALFATGRVGAFNEVDVLPEVSGRIRRLYFTEGATVAQGELLAELNNTDLQAQLEKINVQQELAEKKLARLKKLLDINGVSQEEVEIQQGELKSLQSDKTIVTDQLNKTRITAPFAGVVGLRNVSEGAFVSPSTPIVSLVQMKPLFVEFSIPEKYSVVLQPKQDVEFSLDAGATKDVYKASVYATESRVDEQTRTLRVRAVYAGDKRLLPGSFARVNLTTGAADTTLVLPTSCVIPTLKGQKVYTYHNGTFAEANITTGLRSEEFIEITGGLSAGDTVLTTGLMAIKKDSRIVLIKPRN